MYTPLTGRLDDVLPLSAALRSVLRGTAYPVPVFAIADDRCPMVFAIVIIKTNGSRPNGKNGTITHLQLVRHRVICGNQAVFFWDKGEQYTVRYCTQWDKGFIPCKEFHYNIFIDNTLIWCHYETLKHKGWSVEAWLVQNKGKMFFFFLWVKVTGSVPL